MAELIGRKRLRNANGYDSCAEVATTKIGTLIALPSVTSLVVPFLFVVLVVIPGGASSFGGVDTSKFLNSPAVKSQQALSLGDEICSSSRRSRRRNVVSSTAERCGHREMAKLRATYNQQLGEFEPLFPRPPRQQVKEEEEDGGDGGSTSTATVTAERAFDATERTDEEDVLQRNRRVRCINFVSRFSEEVAANDDDDGEYLPYNGVWDYQKRLVSAHLDRLSKAGREDRVTGGVVSQNGPTTPDVSQWLPRLSLSSKEEGLMAAAQGRDTVLLLQHEPVYTLGTGSDPRFIKEAVAGKKDQQPIDVVRIDRGGEVTYHGPGQLVMYPILDLRGYKKDIHWYIRALEEVVLLALFSAGVEGATREDDLTGVWVRGKKVAALGVKARRWVTMHGLAVNVDSRSLRNFDGIVPCGLEGRSVACVNDFLDEDDGHITVEEFGVHLMEAFEHVFHATLVGGDLAPSADSKNVDLNAMLNDSAT